MNVSAISTTEPSRRDFLYVATAAVGTVGAAATLVPLLSQMNPDASTIAAGAPIEVDLPPISEGQIIKVFWRGKPIFLRHRNQKEIDEARRIDWHNLPDPEPDSARTKQGHDQWLVVIGICTHLGCIPLPHQGDYDGWFVPATARNTTRPVAFAAGPHRRTSICRRMNSFRTAKFGLVEPGASSRLCPNCGARSQPELTGDAAARAM